MEMAAAEQPNAKDRRRRTILLLCIVLLIGGIGAEAYLLIRRAENGIHIIQRDPSAELVDAVLSGDYSAASLIRLTDFPDGIVPETVTQKLTEQAQTIRNAYLAEQTDAAAAKNQLQALMNLEIFGLNEVLEPLYEDVRMREAWLLIIKKADAAFAADNYADAYTQYSRIPHDDTALMQMIADNSAQCAAALVKQTVNNANAAVQAHDYDSALKLIEKTIRIYDTPDAVLADCLQTVQAEQQQYQYLQICQKARNCFDSGNYPDAFAALSEDAPEEAAYTELLADTQKSYQAAYFRLLSVQMHKLLNSNSDSAAGSLAQAEQSLSEAETLFPDAPETADLQKQYADALPKELIAFGEPVLNDFTQTDTALTGFNGSSYQSDSGNLYCSYEGTLSGRQSSSAEFQIGGGYRRLTLTALPLDSFEDDMTVLLEISADESILETYAVSRKAGILHIDLDITGTETLRLRVKPAGKDEDLRNAGIIFADAKVLA